MTSSAITAASGGGLARTGGEGRTVNWRAFAESELNLRSFRNLNAISLVDAKMRKRVRLLDTDGPAPSVAYNLRGCMIARMWHGRTKANDADEYLEYLHKSGIPDYRRTPGNRGAWVFRRIEGDVAHFITLTFWESRDAIRGFAGDDIEVARYYPEDKKYLLEFEPSVTHYEMFE